MIYSRSSEYAIRAFVSLAAVPRDEFALARDIAKQANIPAYFLAKILQQLARHGLLRSVKGPNGGFRLERAPESISLLDIVTAIDGLGDYQRCLGGMTECNDQASCGLHDGWKRMRSSILKYLEETSIADLARSLEQKRRAMAAQRGSRRGKVREKEKNS